MNYRHGHARHRQETPEYRTWSRMLTRCTNPNSKDYPDYGGRGITVCERWMRFENFLVDVGSRPSPKHSIERIDVNKGYEPDNVRWATPIEQARNKRNVRTITHAGETLSLPEWSERIGVSVKRLNKRARMGLPTEQILAPLKPHASKIAASDVAEIRRMWRGGALQKVIAERFGISAAHVSGIVNRKFWNKQEDHCTTKHQ